MPAPKAVRKQVEEAERLMAQLEGGESADDNQPPQDDQEQPGQQQARAEHDEASHDDGDDGQQQGQQQGQPQDQQPDNFEHKYNVLRGKYDKEVPQLHGQLRDMQARQAHLESLIAQMNAPREQEQQPAAPQQTFNKLSPEEVEEYGEDLIDVIRRAAVEAVGNQIAELQGKVENIHQQVGGVTQVVGETKREKVFAKLDQQVENWRELNRSPEFLEWLRETDPYSGNQRGVMLRKAFDSAEADRVIAFFKGFLNEHAAVSPSQSAGSHKGKPNVDANRLVAPGKTRANKVSAGAQDDKRFYTEQEINDFYKAVSRGDYRKKPEEKDKQERDIFRALNEGRVVPTNQVPVSNAAY